MATRAVVTVSSALVSVDFEIFGKVQRVFFRKETKRKADLIGLVGWVKNTDKETVVGQAQGPNDKIKRILFWTHFMHGATSTFVAPCFKQKVWKLWLQTKGSRYSQITKADFKEKSIEKLEYKEFTIR